MLIALRVHAQGNKLSISSTVPKAMTVCGVQDTSRISVYNISSGSVSGIKITLNLPAGVKYIAGSVAGAGVAESNISNLNQPIFTGPTLLVAKNFWMRVKLSSNCDIIPLLSGTNNPEIKVRIDYTGNYDEGTSLPFLPQLPSPGFAAFTNQTYNGNIGNKFIRTLKFTNFGKGPQTIMRLVRVNGKDFSTVVEKAFTNKTSGDTIFTNFGAADFKKIGDKDSLFEQNESITITDTITIKGCTSLTTTYYLQWGCDGSWCQTVKSNAQITISSQNPLLKIWTTSKYSTCYDPTVKNKQGFYFTNAGQLSANSVILSLTRYYSSYSLVDTSSIKIRLGKNGAAKKYSPDSFVMGNAIPCMNNKNEFSLIWFRFPVVKVGDTIYVDWEETRCQKTACGYYYYDANWYVYGQYLNQCKTLNNFQSGWGKYPLYTYAAASTLYPTDLAPGTTKPFRYTINSFSSYLTDTNSRVRIDLVIPKNLIHSLKKSDFNIINAQQTSTWNPDSISIVKDTVRAYMGRQFKFDLVNAEIFIRLTGTCSNSKKNENLPLLMKLMYNTNVNCHPDMWINMACVTTYTKVHCSNYCNGGMRFVDFEVSRTNYGLPDNDNDGLPDKSGNLDTLKLRTERIMVGDTFQTVFVGKPVNRGTTNAWRYGYAQSTMTFGRFVDVIEAKIVDYRYGSVYTGNCNKVRYKKSVTGNQATFFFDFTVDSIFRGGCATSSFRYTASDSVRLIVKYKVTGNVGTYALNFDFVNRFYLSTVANPSTSQSYQCDTFSGSLIYYGYSFVNWGTENITYSNCAETWMHQYFYLGIGPCCNNYGGANVFPYEYRNWAKIKALRLNLPSGLKLSKTQFAQYRTAGINTTAYEYKDTITPNTGTSAPYIFDFSKYFKSGGGKINESDDGFHGYFYYSVIPKCDLPAGTSQKITYDYIFERKNALGTGYDTLFGGEDYFTFVPPTFSLKPAIETQYAYGDTVEWEVLYTNPSSSFDAYNIWISPGKSTNLKVVEVRDKAKDTVIKLSNDIYRAGTMGAGQSRRFRVKATYNKCYPDSLILYGGWNCEKYPTDFASYSCKPLRTALLIEPQNTRLQLTLTDSISVVKLCANNKFTLLMENVQAVTAYKTKVQLTLPIGVEMVPGSTLLKYPLNSSNQSLADPVLLTGTTYEWDLAKLNSTVNAGFKGTTDTAKNKLLITFRVKTNCDYASGSFLRARATANIKCGDPVTVIPAFSNPIDIFGVTRPYYTLMRLWSDTLKVCEKSSNVKARVIFLGPGNSGKNDRVEFFLPSGITRDSNYFVDVRNAPNKDSFYVKDYNGAKLYSWLLPKNIVPGDSIEFDLKVKGDSKSAFCGTYDLLGRSVVVQPIVCITTNQPCDIKVITGGELISPVINKASLSLISPNISSKLIAGDSERIVLNYRVKNNASPNGKVAPIVVKYYYDKDQNGSFNLGDVYLGKDSVNVNLLKDSSVAISKILSIKAGYSCAVLAIVDSAACSCKFGELSFPAPRLVNAGNDTAVCSGNKLFIGGIKSKLFKYLWTPSNIIDNDTLPNPEFIGKNVTGIPETTQFILQTRRGLCISKDTVKITALANPEIKLNIKDTTICQNRPVAVLATALNGNGGFVYRWNTSKGVSDSTKSNIVIKTGTTKSYVIIVKDKLNCFNSDTLKINTVPYPVPDFTWPTACFGDTITVSDNSQIGSGTILWRTWKTPFGDTINAKTIKVFTGTLSKVNISLIAESDFGCIDTAIKWVDVKNVPKNSFTFSNNCVYDSIPFTGNIAIDSGSIVKKEWFISDGFKVSNSQKFAHKFSNAGKYEIVFISVNNYGCSDTAKDSVSVYPKPKAGFTVKNVCAYDSLKFVNLSSVVGDSIAKNNWNFSTGEQLSNLNIALAPKKMGNYSAKLWISTVHNCIDSTSNNYVVYEVPKAKISAKNVCFGTISQFADSSSGSGINKRNWDFGDNSKSVFTHPTHTYSTENSFNVKLKITTNNGCLDSTNINYVVHPLAHPTAIISNLCYKENLISVANYYGKGNPIIYRWNLGNGDSIINKNLNYNYVKPGNYSVKLTVKTDSGCSLDSLFPMTVYELPVVKLTATNPCKDDSVIFKSNNTIGGNSLINSEIWTFADGSQNAQQNITKIFTAPGVYQAKLIAASNRNCKDSALVAYAVYPRIYKGFNATEVCLNEPTVFTNTSNTSVPYTQFAWDFGDKKTSSLENPTHLYATAKSYLVKFKFTTLPGCDYDTSATVVVNPIPTPGFNTGGGVGTIVNPEITVTDESLGADFVSYRTTDGFSFAQPGFTHKFPDSGTYTIWQKVSTNKGCMDSTSKEVVILFMYTLHVPTIFTPDGDNLNESFKPMGMGIKWYNMRVYNRWGQLMYESNDSKPWDGKYKGEKVNDGVYTVLISLRDYKNKPHYYRGTVTIVR